jgi:hypothetical protein
MGMTNDENEENANERFGDFVKREAHAYNAPGGTVPRDEMWAAITTARAEARRAAAARKRYLWVAVGMAATLVIGVAIGRSVQNAGAPGTANGTIAVASTDTGNTSYRVAAETHLVGAEAMLTLFTSAPANAKSDTLVVKWARDLLANTRLLLDSPAAGDANRRRLLQDLERVLVQIVQTSPAESNAEMRAHVERSIDRTHMIMRLRAVQAAAPNGGSEE